MKLVITGAAGFLGRALIAAAGAAGHEVIGVGRAAVPPDGLRVAGWCATDLGTGAEDGFDWEACPGAVVLHLAADTRVHNQDAGFVQAAMTVADAACRIARRTGGGIVGFSSAAVYSGPRTSFPLQSLAEDAPACPATAYGRAKLAMERRIRESGLPFLILRPFSFVGRGWLDAPDRGHLVQRIAHAVRTRTPITLATDGAGRTFVRDYTQVENVARTTLQAAGRLGACGGSGGILNLCTGVPLSTGEMVAAASVAGGWPIPVRYEAQPRLDSTVLVGNPERLNAQLGPLEPADPREFWRELFQSGLLSAERAAAALGPAAAPHLNP